MTMYHGQHRFAFQTIAIAIAALCLFNTTPSSAEWTAADEITQIMMHAQWADLCVLDLGTVSDLELTGTYNIDSIASTFSYSLDTGQTVDGFPISLSSSGAGDLITGLYSWTTTTTLLGATTPHVGTGTIERDPVTKKYVFNGFYDWIGSTQKRWRAKGDVTIDSSTTPHTDTGNLELQLEVLENGEWVEATGNGTNRRIASTSEEHDPGKWTIRSIPYGGSDAIKGTNGSMVWQVPEPSTLTLFVIGAVGLFAFPRRRREKTGQVQSCSAQDLRILTNPAQVVLRDALRRA